jgi:hypothetical protein
VILAAGWAIPYFRALGFFQGCGSDADIHARVRAYYGPDWADTIGAARNMATADQFLLVPDRTRVWFRDLEGVYCGEDAYAESLREWAQISRGVFNPPQIAEQWLSETGPVNVTFSYAGAAHLFVHADGLDDFIDLRIVRLINRLLSATPYRLEACNDLVDCRFITVLDRDEQRQIERDRGWRFCDFLRQ